ncbi:ribosome silencing factor [Acidobacteria bacterium AH-259-G07]|nr:ribosome silencing factor [Acidobacteria bacterium AH-259-G07]MDA2938188.1 ribosome silencing factor [Acidobacteria bacterium AH-259-A15]
MKKTKIVLKKVCQAIEGKKGDHVTIFDVSKISSFTDFFVICHGYNEKQNQAICDEIMEKLKKEAHLFPNHVEGYQHAEWILLDYLDFVVHIFSTRARQFYKLEKLWSDGIEVEPKALPA